MPSPVPGRKVTTPYGKRNARLWKWLGYHTGDDYACPVGTRVEATWAGRVSRVARDGSFGLYVVVDHGGGVTSWYCHLSRTSVKPGVRVVAGTLVGLSGMSGNVTGPHVHYEERVRGLPRKPQLSHKAAPKKTVAKIPAFPRGIGPGKSRPSAKKLQLALQRLGYMPTRVKRADNYGPQTQAAVARFHGSSAGRKFRGRGLKRDIRIGPKGWAYLMAKAKVT